MVVIILNPFEKSFTVITDITKRCKEHLFNKGWGDIDISGMKHDYYLKGSSAYEKALKEFGYK